MICCFECGRSGAWGCFSLQAPSTGWLATYSCLCDRGEYQRPLTRGRGRSCGCGCTGTESQVSGRMDGGRISTFEYLDERTAEG